VLDVVAVKFDGGPVGLDTMAAALGEDATTLEEACEPFLLQQGLLMRTPRGRVITSRGRAHLGLPPENVPDDGQGSLL
jgi:Holliday junction DNA helicase RuvB